MLQNSTWVLFLLVWRKNSGLHNSHFVGSFFCCFETCLVRGLVLGLLFAPPYIEI